MNTSINVSYYDYINYNSDYYNKIVIIKHVTVVWILVIEKSMIQRLSC